MNRVSIRERVRIVDRYPPEVTENVDEFADYGLIELEDVGRAKQPTVWYDTDDAGTYRLTFEPYVETVETDLRAKLETEPQLTSGIEEFTEQKRRVRDHVFARLVKAAYDYRCAICDGYEIPVADAQERDGYHEFEQLEGTQLTLPDDGAMGPRRLFLEHHRELLGF
nr:hypothetical protein [Halomicroarcula nitratireducens]